jgi:hypothetical protein
MVTRVMILLHENDSLQCPVAYHHYRTTGHCNINTCVFIDASDVHLKRQLSFPLTTSTASCTFPPLMLPVANLRIQLYTNLTIRPTSGSSSLRHITPIHVYPARRRTSIVSIFFDSKQGKRTKPQDRLYIWQKNLIEKGRSLCAGLWLRLCMVYQTVHELKNATKLV